MSSAILRPEDDGAMSQTPLDARSLINLVLQRLTAVYEVMDDHGFHQEALSEEVVYRRFVQQQ